ncbi:MAG: SpaA isopeptide-forming pilin-related protein [Coriobacteriaceae bacterium]|nr:SpaA isopeptide-forming pilin-related protein [Coriobacteriaceae bacterium]
MSISRKITTGLVASVCALLLGVAVLLVAAVPQAHAADVQGSTLTATAGVSDEVTKLDVAKVDAGVKHEPVSGAQLQILEKDSGKVVYSWTSSDEAEQIHKVLNVNTAYILHEVSAPEGYETAPDTEFSIDDYGTVSFSTGGTIENNAELTDKYSVNLYDKKVGEERIIYLHGDAATTNVSTAQTGDNTPFMLVAIVLVIAVAGVGITAAARRRHH